MKEVLVDLVQQLAPLFTKIRVATDEGVTKFSSYLDDRNLLVVGQIKQGISDLVGDFGVHDLSMLKGLLALPLYKGDEAKFIVHRTKHDDIGEYVSEFEFRDRHNGRSRFKTMSAKMAGDQVTIANIPWELSFSPSKSKVTEIAKLAGLFSGTDTFFGLNVDEQNRLFMTIGGRTENTHSATIMVTEDVDPAHAKLINSTNPLYNLVQFNAILGNADKASSVVKFSSRGVIGIAVDTEYCSYTFFLRANKQTS